MHDTHRSPLVPYTARLGCLFITTHIHIRTQRFLCAPCWAVVQAPTMNDSYLKAGFPPGHQTPEEIKRILDEAKGRIGGSGGKNKDADDSYDNMMDSAINEDLRTHKSAELQRYVKAHR
jgi:hypothetical protein